MTPPNNPQSASLPPKAGGVETQKALESVPFHLAALDWRDVKLRNGLIYDLQGGRRVEVWEVGDEDGLACRIFRPDNEGKRSKLLFGLSLDAACALMSGLVEKLAETPSVGRGNAANPPPGNPEVEECEHRMFDGKCDICGVTMGMLLHGTSVAAAAEDVAGEEWTAESVHEIRLNELCGNENKGVADAHNSCISRLQEQIAYWKSEWNVQTASRDALLASAEKAEEQIKTLTQTAKVAGQIQREELKILFARAEEAEAKLAALQKS